MHSAAQEKAASPRKRTLSRGMSEEETLRHIMKEAEETTRRLTRSDSRYGSLKKGETRESVSEEEHLEDTTMAELQANYEDCLQELQSLELQKGVLIFQVDCLQDALEGAEEMLAETQREAHEANMELEREREKRKKLEATVASLMQELERLKEEKNSVVRELLNSTSQEEKQPVEVAVDGGHLKETSVFPVSPDRILRSLSAADGSSQFSAAAILSFFKNRKAEAVCSKPESHAWPPGSPEGTSVDQEVPADRPDRESQAAGVQRKVEVQEVEENDESSGYEDAPSEFSPGPSTPDMPLDPGLLADEIAGEEGELKDGSDPRSPRSPDSCAMS